MIEVFKTDVQNVKQSELLIRKLQKHIPNSCINFDLEDIDNILRVEAENVPVENIILLLNKYGHGCEVLQ